jgi:hypothetical protein
LGWLAFLSLMLNPDQALNAFSTTVSCRKDNSRSTVENRDNQGD